VPAVFENILELINWKKIVRYLLAISLHKIEGGSFSTKELLSENKKSVVVVVIQECYQTKIKKLF
jgi:hypothetical protein